MMMSEFSFENLYRAYLDCRKNKRNKPDALFFEINAEENLEALRIELAERTYRPSPSDCFAAKKPKLREIFAADFRDRIIHHLAVRYLERIWEPVFIYDSFASRIEKGIHLAAARLRRFTRKVTRNKSIPAFYMQLDIRNFFMTIDKDILFGLIASRCKNPEILWLTHQIIYNDPTLKYRLKSSAELMNRIPRQKSLFGIEKNKGLPIGNLTSQFFANIYLNGLDQFVKHTLKCRFYMRYVDDFILLHSDKSRLEEWKKSIEHYLGRMLRLKLNDNRSKLCPVSNGIDFLGYVVRPDYVLCRNRVVNNLKTRLKEFDRQLISNREGIEIVRYDGKMLDKLFACLNSYLAHFKHADTRNLVQTVFQKHFFLNYFFSLKNGKLIRIYLPPGNFSRLQHQYRYFLKKYHFSLIFFQVGCFYEFYSAQVAKAIKYLKLKRIPGKHGFRRRCGIGINALDRYVDMALLSQIPVVVINQTGYLLNYVQERKPEMLYLPIEETGVSK